MQSHLARVVAAGAGLALGILGLTAPGASALGSHGPSAAPAAGHHRTDKPTKSGQLRPIGTVDVRKLPRSNAALHAGADPVHEALPDRGQLPRTTGLQAIPTKGLTHVHSTRPSATTAGTVTQDAIFGGAESQGNTPPDTQVAAGTNDVVEMVNSQMIITNKAGNQVQAPADVCSFFKAGPTSTPGGTVNLPTCSDPKVVYNRYTGHWYATELIYDSTTMNSVVNLAVSQTADPTGAWYLYNLHYEAGVLEDQPKLGMSSDKLVITWNDYTGTGSNQSYTQTETDVLDQAETDNYGNVLPLDYDLYSDGTTKVFPAVNADTGVGSTSDAYEVFYSDGVFGLTHYINVITVSGSPSQLPRSSRSYSNGIGVAGVSDPPSVPQPKSTQQLDAGDDRIQSASYRNGTLWSTGSDSCSPSGQTLACLRVDELTNATASTPTLGLDTDLYLPATHLMYPALALDDNNDIFLTASASSSTMYASWGFFSAQSGGTNIAGNIIASGLGPLSCTAGQDCGEGGNIRYGDYSGISLDGANPNALWIAGEYGNAVSTTPSATWGTFVGEYQY